jgi:hypothetical protein
MPAPLQIHTIESLPFAENTYVVWLPERKDALVIDPGLEPQLILDFLREHALTPTAILNTHGHGDHIGGNAALKAAYPTAPLIIGANEAALLTDANANLSAPFGSPITSPPADQLIREGDVVEAAESAWRYWMCPGIRLAMSYSSTAIPRVLFSAGMCCFATASVATTSPTATASFFTKGSAPNFSLFPPIRWSIRATVPQPP